MAMAEVTPHETPSRKHLFKTGKDRLAAWEKVRGMWKGRIPDPIAWLEKSRAESERELPPLHRE